MNRLACAVAISAGLPAAAGASLAPAASPLQVSLTAPKTTVNGDTVTVDVGFRKGDVRTVDLYVDGQLVKHQPLRTTDAHGTLVFQLAAGALAGGTHLIEVRATDAQGHTAATTSRLVIADRPLASGPVRLTYPRTNALVQGTVPIQVNVDESVHNPYVSFFVDNEFLSLSNFAPFTYNWDSTRAQNGRHVVKVITYNGETAAEMATLSVPILVDNPGGFTTLRRDTAQPAPKASAASKPIRATVATAVTTSPVAAARATVVGEEAVTDVVPGVRIGDVLRLQSSTAFAPRMRVAAVGFFAAAPPELEPARTRAAVAAARGNVTNPMPFASALAALTSEPAALPVSVPNIARTALQPRSSGLVAIRPSYSLGAASFAGPAIRAQSGVTPAAVHRMVSTAAAATHLALDVVFDSVPLKFDVPPRVKAGLPFTPFRLIFEQSGGTVKWYNATKTVHAYNQGRDVRFQIGRRGATVNSHNVQMDATPFIDGSRSIVPLSFIQEAMSVNVQYDPGTGHIRITSHK